MTEHLLFFNMRILYIRAVIQTKLSDRQSQNPPTPTERKRSSSAIKQQTNRAKQQGLALHLCRRRHLRSPFYSFDSSGGLLSFTRIVYSDQDSFRFAFVVRSEHHRNIQRLLLVTHHGHFVCQHYSGTGRGDDFSLSCDQVNSYYQSPRYPRRRRVDPSSTGSSYIAPSAQLRRTRRVVS